MVEREAIQDAPLRELGFDQTDEPVEKANLAPEAKPTVESVEKACEQEELGAN